MSLWIKSCGLTINMKPLQQYVHRVQFIQYVVLTLSVNEIIWCDHSNETSSAVLSHGTLYLVCSCNSGSTLVVFVFQHSTKWNVEILLNFEHGYFWKQLSRDWPGSPTSWGTQPDTFLWQFLPFIMVSMTWLSASLTLCAEGWRKKEPNQNYRNGFCSSNCYYKSECRWN